MGTRRNAPAAGRNRTPDGRPSRRSPSRSAAGSYLMIAVAVLVVAGVLFIILADNALRRGAETPDVLRPVSPSPTARATPVERSSLAITPQAVIIDLEVPTGSAGALLAPTAVPVATQAVDRYFLYTVQSGDTLAAIAARFGYSFEEIANLNGIDEPWIIQITQELLIPNR